MPSVRLHLVEDGAAVEDDEPAANRKDLQDAGGRRAARVVGLRAEEENAKGQYYMIYMIYSCIQRLSIDSPPRRGRE